ncbi:hypothetical protein CHS0354_040516 [Potamilus streckersoni]|uniref:Uncharacterized protein n=1 Tax=Potamilus streckersoni TaxID=2493646 RepID=A0AAE0TJW2_9BIVA|nr:hypothetical protein CHS0354_040516 [Potamilus streckersoni]
MENVDYAVVAAIDLGTTYSSWACSFRHDYNKDPKNLEKIMCRNWNDSQNVSYKAPTTILVREDGKTLDKFGYEAEDQFAQFAEDDADELNTWYYFRRFKMLLHDRKIKRDMMLESENSKTLPAMRVFALTIKYLMNDILVDIGKKMMDVLDESHIRWVLTVPAIWDETAKQFMREAATEAGIPSNQLTLALEPEVASLYCNSIPLTRADNGEASTLHPGAKYILVDAGGGTIDIIAHEVMSDGSLNEIYRSNGGAWGGTEVDKEYLSFLKDLVGTSVFENFKKNHMDDYLYLCREFEQKKRTIEPVKDLKVTTRFPGTLNELFENEKHQTLANSILSKKWSQSVTPMSDKIRMESHVMKGFFADALQKTGSHLQHIFSGESSLKTVNTIMMVGGFSESKMLQEVIIKLFPEKRVIVPPQAGLAVLKGAVLFGHNPSAIGHRVCRFSYGVKTSVAFVKGKHSETRESILEMKIYVLIYLISMFIKAKV